MDEVAEVLLTETSTIGFRRIAVTKSALARTWFDVPAAGGTVRIKVAHRGGRIVQATPEFEDAAALARSSGRPVRAVLDEATAAAVARGLLSGGPLPD
nr:nickel insertion protein [Amycolatopsis thermophila]